ncbi:MAG: SDR family NAD(P)-dependent oxidoreductase [Sphingomonadaceae bacterium]|nr:SDR family NAD(P)-dependent oxidoreductase [Sphingomonadaceae bacterium]
MSAIQKGAVAIVTGAAGGIGLGLATEAVRRGMRVVISDIREDKLRQAQESLTAMGGEVLAMRADVTSEADVENLAKAAVDRFGQVNMLFNNAGAFVGGLAWETSAAQMDWIVELNFKSVAHGIRAFVPRMIAQGDPCHVVTIASGAGIAVYPGYATYSPTKHAALALTEALYIDLVAEKVGNIGVTIAMPGMIRTEIMEPEKASPSALDLDREARHENATVKRVEQLMTGNLEKAMPPEELARIVFDAAEAGELYILPNHDSDAMKARCQAIGTGRATGVNPYPAIMGQSRLSGAKEDAPIGAPPGQLDKGAGSAAKATEQMEQAQQ